jgi:hypothetical protein
MNLVTLILPGNLAYLSFAATIGSFAFPTSGWNIHIAKTVDYCQLIVSWRTEGADSHCDGIEFEEGYTVSGTAPSARMH